MTHLRASIPLLVWTAVVSGLTACDESPPPAAPDPVVSVRISPDTALVRIGASSQLQAEAVTAGGRVAAGRVFTWTSSDTTVATVTPAGVVTARRYGRASVSASADGVAGSVPLLVTGEPGLHVVSGGTGEDTISAVLAVPLVVELRDGRGLPAAGSRIGVHSPMGALLVQSSTSLEYLHGGSAIADVEGRVSFRVRLGTEAGTAALVIQSGLLADTTHYTVRAGAPSRIRVTPRDTVVFAGRTVPLRHVVEDRGGNPLGVSASFSVVHGPGRVDAERGIVTTAAYGTTGIAASIGDVVDSVRVAAVPEGALVAEVHGDLVLVNTDGTGRRILGGGTAPAWSPAGDAIVHQSNWSGDELRVTALDGASRPLSSTLPAPRLLWPQYAADGGWVYFFNAPEGAPQRLWRVRADGTGLESVGSGEDTAVKHPHPSPDGSRVVFATGYREESYLRILNLATGAQSGKLASGDSPVWSPGGDLIAFNELRTGPVIGGYPGALMVMRPDGTEVRRVSRPGEIYEYSPRWSPDGRWLVASAYGPVHLVEVATGLTIVLPFLESVKTVAWRPGGPLP